MRLPSIRLLLTIIIVLSGLTILFLRLTGKISPLRAEWFNDSWAYRNSIPIMTHATDQSNVYISLTLSLGSTLNSQADNGDLRFTKQNGQLLPYYISSGAGTTAPVVQIFLDSFPVGASTLYYYYGNFSVANGFSSASFSTEASSYTIGTLGTQEKTLGPISYWKFDEGSGTTVNDSIRTNHGTFGTGSSAPSWQTEDQCISNKCLKFDGVNDYINIGSTISPINTFSFWLKPVSVGQSLISFGSANVYLNSSNQIGTSGIPSPTIYVNGAVSTNISTNQWQLITVTTNTPLTGNSISIGRISTSFTSSFFDEVKIYSYVRTPAQIKADFNSRGAATAKGSSANLGSSKDNSDAFSKGLVGYWKMEEASTPSLDSSGNAYDADWGGNTTSAVGKFGKATTYDGTTDYDLVNPKITALDGKGEMTSSVWVKPGFASNAVSRPHRSVFYLGDGGPNMYFVDTSDEYMIVCDIGTSNGYFTAQTNATATWSTDTWHFLVCRYTGSQVEIYWDNALVGSIVASGAILSNSNPYSVIGATNTTLDSFLGSLDELRVYSRALSPSEVSQLYNWAPGPVAHWKLDEGSWNNDCSTDTAFDSSGNGYHGDSCPASSGPTTPIAGKYGKGLSVTGNKRIDTTARAGTLWGTGSSSFTVSAWLNPTTQLGTMWDYPTMVGAQATVGGCQVTGGLGAEVTNSTTGTIYFSLPLDSGGACASSTVIGDSSSMVLNEWHYYTGTFDGATGAMKLYKDGVLVDSDTWGGSGAITWTSSGYISLNQGMGSDYWDGGIDDVRIYNYVRTPAQIMSDMSAGRQNQMIAWYKFDEGYKTIANNSGSAGSAQNGTFGTGNSAPTWSNNGQFGKSLLFDGSNDYLSVGATVSVQTISFWAYPTSSSTPFLSLGSASALISVSGVLTATGFSSPQYYVNGRNTTTLTSNTWQHIAVVSAGDTITALNLNIGKSGPTYYAGLIDEVKIYNYSLSQNEIITDYNQGKTAILGALSQNSGSTAPVNASSQEYCIPGDTTACVPPIAEWSFNEGTGTSVFDTSGNNLHGTFGTGASAPSWATGKISRGLLFNPANNGQFVAIADPGASSLLDFTTGQTITMQAWFKLNSTPATNTWHTIFAKGATAGTANGNYYFQVGKNGTNDQIDFCFDANNGINCFSYDDTNNNLLRPGQWHHLAATFTYGTPSSARLYFDSILKTGVWGDPAGNGIPTQSNDPIWIGNDRFSASGYEPFDGYIDSVKIFNYARTPAQIALDYNRNQPKVWYKFDECQGHTLNDSSGLINSNITIGTAGSLSSLGTCSIGGTTAWGVGSSGKFNSSLAFDGTNDYANTDSTINLTSTSIITTSFWLNWDSNANDNDLALESSTNYNSNNGAIMINPNSTASGICTGKAEVSFRSWGASEYHGECITRPSAGVWHHWVVIFDYSISTNNIKIYIDGIEQPSSVLTQGAATGNFGNYTWYFMNRAGSSLFAAGRMDDFRLYPYALTPTQIKTLYNQNFPVRFGPLQGSP